MLVVLEDQDRAKGMVKDLEAKGCQVRYAPGMRQAVKALGEKAYDMVLTHALMSPEQRQEMIEKARQGNPDVIVILMGTGAGEGDDHDTVSWGTQSDVFTPAGLPEVWDRVASYLNQTRLNRRVSHAWDLIRGLQNEVSEIMNGVSVLVWDELSDIAAELRSLLDGRYGLMDSRASDRIHRLLERVEGLAGAMQCLGKGLLKGQRPAPE